MKRTQKLLIIHLTTLFVFILATATMKTIACLTDYSFTTGYFKDKFLIYISDIAVVVGCAVGASYMFIEKNKVQYKASFDNALTYIPAGMVSVALVFVAAAKIFGITKLPGKFWSAETFSDIENVISILIAVFALVSVGYFLVCALIEKSSSNERAAFGLVMTSFLAIFAADIYFSHDLSLNSPIKIAEQLAYATTAVFFLYETRISLNRGKWDTYASFGFIAALVSGYFSIPALIVYFSENRVIASSLASATLMLTVCIFICARLILILKLYVDKKCDTVNAITLMATERVKEIEQLRLAHAHDIIYNEENGTADTDDANDYTDDDTNYTIDIDSINPEKSNTDGEQ